MNKTSFKVSDLGEKELIDRIISRNSKCSSFSNNFDFNDFKTNIGDDSALINHNLANDSYIVASSDMLIQSTHFPKEMSYYQMGYKSVVVNVSDLAAMGAKPIGFLLNLAIPNDLNLDDFDELICGVTSACADYHIPLVGGDTNEANEIIISATAMGSVQKDEVLMKYGFNPGDLICITGEIGLAALGFEILCNDKKLEIAKSIDSSFVDLALFKSLKPKACLKESFILSKYNYNLSSKDNCNINSRIACTDITDGVASELYEILKADKQYYLNNINNTNKVPKVSNEFNLEDVSKCCRDSFEPYSKGILLYEDKLPIEDEFKEISSAIGSNYFDLIFHVGEDFELLFTIPKEIVDSLKEDLDFFVIGEVINSEDNSVELLDSEGKTVVIKSKGYEHLSSY